MKSEKYQEIVRKTLEVIGSNLSRELSIGEIAKRAGYSRSRLGTIFQKTTGHSILEHILELKLEEAKKLLTKTQLNIIEVALEAGFGSHEHFTRFFRARTGMSPSQFRNVNPLRETVNTEPQHAEPVLRPREWAQQAFAGEELSADLKIRQGSLSQENGYVAGLGIEAFDLVLLRDLPENVEINLDVKLLTAQYGGPTHAVLGFSDESFSAYWHTVVIDTQDLHTAYLTQLQVNRRTNPNPSIRPDQWQTLRVQFVDERISAFLDNEKLFDFQNDFPPSYKQRCRFSFGAWQSSVLFRNLSIKDLGVPALTRSIRQGDALYNAKAYEAAREFFCRLLETQTSKENAQELHYKIGMCLFFQSAFSQARSWLERAIAMGDDGFWREQSELNLMRLDILAHNPAGITKARQFLANPAMRDEAMAALRYVWQHDGKKGDFKRALFLQKLVIENRTANEAQFCDALMEIAETQEWLLQLDESEKSLKIVAASAAAHKASRQGALRELGYVYQMQGKLDPSESCYRQIAQSTANPDIRADCDIHRAFLLRAQDKTADALSLLEEVAKRPGIPDRSGLARIEAALILCGLGKNEEAREEMQAALELKVWILQPQSGTSSHYLCVPELVFGNFEEAADLLLTDSRTQDGAAFKHAEQAMAAGFIMEISGDKKKSRKIWAEMLRRFPLQRCGHFAPLAEILLRSEMPNLAGLPLGHQGLSEMLYLAARACEAKGDHAQSRILLEHCLQLDSSLRWPAFMAKRTLAKR